MAACHAGPARLARMGAAVPGTLDQSRFVRLAALAGSLAALFVSACAANQNPPSIAPRAGGQLVVQVPDSLNDAGRVPSVALDQNGNPAIAYLLLKAPVKKGEIPPPVIAGQPQPPAVVLATQANGAWSRVSVTKQSLSPDQGEAEGIAYKDKMAGPPVHTGLAVDAQGKHHVAWSAATGLYYDDDAGGAFGDPVKVTGGQTYGAAIALSPDGSPWISFYLASGLRVAHRVGTGWKVEDVAPGAGPGGGAGVLSAIGVAQDGTTLIAYGDHGHTMLARSSGGGWNTEAVPGDGGLGVSMALDKSGNPHLAYYDGGGHVRHAHSLGGGPWEVTDLATVTSKSGGATAAWSTGIALDDKGVHYVTWADTGRNDVVFATNSGGTFRSSVVPDSLGGANPSIAVSADGKKLALAWYDTVNENLEVASPSAGGLAFAFSPPPRTAAASPSASAAQCSPSGTTLKVTAKGIAFDTNCLAAPAGKAVTIDFSNQDAGTPHNVDIYTTSPTSGGTHLAGAKDVSDTVTGVASTTYDVSPLKKGQYYFQCDIHPQQMFGTFIVS